MYVISKASVTAYHDYDSQILQQLCCPTTLNSFTYRCRYCRAGALTGAAVRWTASPLLLLLASQSQAQVAKMTFLGSCQLQSLTVQHLQIYYTIKIDLIDCLMAGRFSLKRPTRKEDGSIMLLCPSCKMSSNFSKY